MTEVTPDQIWWTADEIASAEFPDMPTTKRRVNAMAARLEWRGQTEFARRRSGRGGGWEYHWKLFPLKAQKRLVTTADNQVKARPGRDVAWSEFEALPERTKAVARARLDVLNKIDALVGAGQTRSLAASEIAKLEGKSERTIWNWFGLVEGVRIDDRLPYLAPAHKAGQAAAKRKVSECSPEAYETLKADYLRFEQPSFSASYRRVARIAKQNGWDMLPERTMRRRLNEDVTKESQILARKGADALKAMYPPQRRDKTSLHALEAVNADFHRFDVFVRWPIKPGSDTTEIVRPQMVAFQDIYSGRILSWRVSQTPNKATVALALGDLIEEFGIPDHMLLDNGREFANKYLTGQTTTRNRFKIKDDDIPGLLVSLGVKVHWATPYSGQSKPIERAFRDLCDDVAKDPRLAGAYTGNRPDAKPENWGSKAIDLDEFLAVVAEGIEEHNARPGRRSETASGRSLMETFEASYANAPIRKATSEQRRIWLMGAEGLRPDSKTGLIRFQKNEYWAPWLHGVKGQKIVARFDPADLWAGLHIYTLQNEYLGLAECRAKVGFFDLEEGRTHARARAQWMTAEKKALAAARKMKVTDIANHLNALTPPPQAQQKQEAKVVRPMFADQSKTLPKQKRDPELEKAQAALVAEFEDHRKTAPASPDDQQSRFKRALELEARIKADEEVSGDDRRWLNSYQNEPEYRAMKHMYEDFGDGMLG